MLTTKRDWERYAQDVHDENQRLIARNEQLEEIYKGVKEAKTIEDFEAVQLQAKEIEKEKG